MRAVIVGGFAESKSLLEPVGHAVCDAGLAEDADIFLLRDIYLKDRDLHLEKASQGQLAITHSAGIMAINPYTKPEMLVAYNGPEPRSIGRLVLSALIKSGNHVGDSIVGPNRKAHLKAFLANNAELIAHPLDNFRNLGEISRFSTAKRLGSFINWGWNVAAVVSKDDEFFKPSVNETGSRPYSFQIIPGGHDELLVNPAEVIVKTFPEF